MKKLTLLFVAMVIASINLMALEPIAVIVNSNSGQGLSAKLMDYGNPNNIAEVYSESLPTTSPNSSGLIPFIIGSGSSDWAEIEASDVTAYYVINILDSDGKIIAQFRLDGLINTSAQSGVVGGNLTVGGNATINGSLLLSSPQEFTTVEGLSSLTGTIFVYTGNNDDDYIDIDADDLNANIPDNTLFYLVNNSQPDGQNESDEVWFYNDGSTVIFPGNFITIMKIGGEIYTMPYSRGF